VASESIGIGATDAALPDDEDHAPLRAGDAVDTARAGHDEGPGRVVAVLVALGAIQNQDVLVAEVFVGRRWPMGQGIGAPL
jgi:hypothetical protein